MFFLFYGRIIEAVRKIYNRELSFFSSVYYLYKKNSITKRPLKKATRNFFLTFREKSLLADAFSGRILIDGVDIAELGLGTLRSKLTIIPQVTTIHNVVFAREDPDQRVLKNLKRTRLSCCGIIGSSPPAPLPPVSKLSLFLSSCV